MADYGVFASGKETNELVLALPYYTDAELEGLAYDLSASYANFINAPEPVQKRLHAFQNRLNREIERRNLALYEQSALPFDPPALWRRQSWA